MWVPLPNWKRSHLVEKKLLYCGKSKVFPPEDFVNTYARIPTRQNRAEESQNGVRVVSAAREKSFAACHKRNQSMEFTLYKFHGSIRADTLWLEWVLG